MTKDHAPRTGDHHSNDHHSHDHQSHEPGHNHHHAHGSASEDRHDGGVRGFLHELFVPHTHDPAESVDDAWEASTLGVSALKISMVMLLGTTAIQFAIVLISGSVALLADTVHNFSDALTAVPLWIAFVIGRRAATRRFTYGFGRAEDLAGLFIMAVVALSAVVAAWQSVDRLLHPEPLTSLGWVAVAGVVGFLGNEAVASYRIRIGRRIGSAALVADGVHARMDGLTSLAVVVGAAGVRAGFPLADPIVGLLISVMIVFLLLGTTRSIGRRLLDGIEPDLIIRARSALEDTEGVLAVRDLRLRWVGHRLTGDALILTEDRPLSEIQQVAAAAEAHLRSHLGNVDLMLIRATSR